MILEFTCDFRRWQLGYSWGRNMRCVNLLCLAWLWYRPYQTARAK
jgi:hypothetical protein